MLRVYTPASSHPTTTGRSPLTRQSHADGLRRQIVDMVQQQGLTTSISDTVGQTSGQTTAEPTDQPLEPTPTPEPTTVIYQIRKKGGIASTKQADDRTDKKNDNLKKIHLKILRETRGRGSRSFPAIDDQFRDSPINDENRKDPFKRPKTIAAGDTKPSAVPKVSFRLNDTKPQPLAESSNTGMQSNVNNSVDSKYEIRGSAIRSSRDNKSAPAYRSSEASKRHMTIHTSLQLFKRKLKLNHPDSYIQPNVSTNDSDYVIRRVPLKYDRSGGRITSMTSPSPLEPRLQVISSVPRRSKTPVNQLNAMAPGTLLSRPTSGTEVSLVGEEKKIRCSYRLPDNFNWSKEVSFRDDTEMIPNVNTYVVEEGLKKATRKYDGHATLSTHNLDVHNALTSNNDRKVKLGEGDEEFDPRFARWLEESNLTYKPNVRAHSSPGVRLRPPDLDGHETDNVHVPHDLVEVRCKTPFPDTEQPTSNRG
ncbi:uncharacterized protein LOC110462217 [Mizuhopecten yessoensis]|uniref:Uncharacterized protein n=1 Tax=Mizuhopecten yessoensis TaxID=6573 RepID=A0A210R2V9_MIZYE|nr:uncharacterized protein LOC110462217 [Mizuhopecten yessoensis]XP_021371765.1 uncharacterized protein LOC110462217 [Mizuhopecten yessoensis]XP_021371774.1 uncharacterized protein LOC110462217 [Mizuhopecten yessoensis]XP_021371781.1 uncharacterized protein LOC110462217 [Mizuhopecten yessoensis]XP_021371788.1 uncharacterized protein LOC110462217 [Mizuhopecten yessoensis]XP_021371797.1 uncharacterized protein LOC110462217 [Mizuhopecten yessoensis]XP_021371805.1 uncharacterized protein LOC11046